MVKDKLNKDGTLTLSGQDYHYLRTVRRMKVGDMLKVVFPDNKTCNTTISKIIEENKTILLTECATREEEDKEEGREGGVDYYLFSCIARPATMETVIREATECGVKKIIPVISSYTQGEYVRVFKEEGGKEGGRRARFSKIIKEAREQSSSKVDTKIGKVIKIESIGEEWKSNILGKKIGFLLYENSIDCIEVSEALGKIKENFWQSLGRGEENIRLSIALVVGAEGGFNFEEVQLLRREGFNLVHFNTNILKVETATVYGFAVIAEEVRKKIKGLKERR